MTKTFTHDDLIRYCYQETSADENISLEQAMLFDEVLLDNYLSLRVILEQLSTLEEEPSSRVVKKILDQSRAGTLHKC